MWRRRFFQSRSPKMLVCAILLAGLALPLTAPTGAEAQFRGFSMRKMPRFGAPRVPRTGIPHARSLTNKVPHAATSKLGKSSVVSRKPPLTTGSLKKPTTGTNQLSTPTRQLTSQPKALTTAAKPSSAPKADQWGWSDCHSKGGVWGANGSCGHPTFTGTGGSGVQGHGPRLAAIPWFVPIVPHAFVDPLPCPAGFEKVGETFYGGTKCAPIAFAEAEKRCPQGFEQGGSKCAAAASRDSQPAKPEAQHLACQSMVPQGAQPAIWSGDSSDFQKIANDPRISNAIQDAWKRSKPDLNCKGSATCAKHEECFWIVRDDVTGELSTSPGDRSKAADHCDLGSRPAMDGRTAIATFHTHPFTDEDGFVPGERSSADILNAAERSLPSIVKHQGGCFYYGPSLPAVARHEPDGEASSSPGAARLPVVDPRDLAKDDPRPPVVSRKEPPPPDVYTPPAPPASVGSVRD
jgi:hypothetical protein